MDEKPSIEEAPLEEFCEILTSMGRGMDAELAKQFYLNLLIPNGYTEEQVMKTSYKNLVEASKLILEQASKEIIENSQPAELSGTSLVGKGVDEETLKRVLPIHNRRHEEFKAEQMFKR